MKLKNWKNWLVIAAITPLMLLAFGGFVSAAETVKTVTFAWDQDDVTNLTQWEMHWSVTAGGPYIKVATILYNEGSPAGAFESPVEATVTGNPGTTETRYFVLRACGDLPQEGGGTVYECSDDSNEISYGFWIPAGKFKVPINFRIVPDND